MAKVVSSSSSSLLASAALTLASFAMHSLLLRPLPSPTTSGRLGGRVSPAAPRRPGAVVLSGDGRCRRGGVVAAGAGAWMEEARTAVLEEAARRNPALSESYRPAGLPRPNGTVLEAQGRVCTGPEQTRPLGEEQAMRVLDTILRSATGELKDDPVSSAQLGAFFAGMTIRANCFPEATQWSEGERRAMSLFWPRLVHVLPPEVKFIADPEGTIMGANGSTGPRYIGQGTAEMRLVGALREVLAGGHLGYEEVQCVLKDVLPVGSTSANSTHIKKRPPLATSEKVQQFVRASGRESMVAGFYHVGYEDPLLMLMRRRTVHAGLVVKGEEGALSLTTKERSANASKGLPVNHCSGFRTPNSANYSETDGISRESFSVAVNAQELGFKSTETPRTDRSVLKNLELGLSALGGDKGPAYDRIVLNAAMADHLLGCSGAQDINFALDRAREAIDSGNALRRLMNYIKVSHKVS
uniref:Uncharacterized protein n=1 Tax=Avena sativa TaxID=4498 RepID=A0ACD5V8D2_AVESA